MNLAGPSPSEMKTLDGNDDDAHVPDVNASDFIKVEVRVLILLEVSKSEDNKLRKSKNK